MQRNGATNDHGGQERRSGVRSRDECRRVTDPASGTASAWPTPITPEQQRYIDQARGAGFPGDDDAVFQAGLQACRALYTNQGVQGATGTVAGQAGVNPDQAGVAVRLARGILCTQAPGETRRLLQWAPDAAPRTDSSGY